MKLSEQVYVDFLREIEIKSDNVYGDNYKKTRTYEMSYGYLTDLIQKIKDLEEGKNE